MIIQHSQGLVDKLAGCTLCSQEESVMSGMGGTATQTRPSVIQPVETRYSYIAGRDKGCSVRSCNCDPAHASGGPFGSLLHLVLCHCCVRVAGLHEEPVCYRTDHFPPLYTGAIGTLLSGGGRSSAQWLFFCLE